MSGARPLKRLKIIMESLPVRWRKTPIIGQDIAGHIQITANALMNVSDVEISDMIMERGKDALEATLSDAITDLYKVSIATRASSKNFIHERMPKTTSSGLKAARRGKRESKETLKAKRHKKSLLDKEKEERQHSQAEAAAQLANSATRDRNHVDDG